jgi:hypothetical protein
MLSDDNQAGWVGASVLTDTRDLSRVSVRDDYAMVNLARPTLSSAEIANGARAYLTQVAATNNLQSPLSQYVEACFELAHRVGDKITCRMERAYCDFLPDAEGRPTVCTDRPAPDQTFALVVYDQDWSEYDRQCLLVTGYLEVNWGMLQIHALRRAQVSPCE